YAQVTLSDLEFLRQRFSADSETVTFAEYIKVKVRVAHRNVMISLIRNALKQGLSEDLIARIINLDPALIRKVLNNETVDIPFHLLDQE
nr:hypothetical protein [Desulfobulbaceae bacterium]